MLIKNIRLMPLKNVVSLLFLSVLIGCLFFEPVNQLTDSLMPTRTVTISVEQSDYPGNEVWILNAEGDANLFYGCWDGKKSGYWECRDAETWDYAFDIIVAYGESVGASISFSTPLALNSYICFWSTPVSGVVRIKTDTDEFFQDLCGDTYEAIKVYPFRNSMLPVLVLILVYAALFALCFVILLIVYYVLVNKERHQNFLSGEVNRWHGLLVWVALYIWAVIQYCNGIPNFLKFGDQVYYWIAVGTDPAAWNAEVVAESTYCFRGYLCNLFPVISQVVGNLRHCDPALIYFLFTSSALAWLTAYVLPEIYRLLTNRKATLLQVLISLMVYLFFWNGTLTAVLTDLFGAVAFFSGIMFAIKFWKNRDLVTAAFSGISWAIACNYRTAYQYGILVILAFSAVNLLVKRLKTLKDAKMLGRKAGAVLLGIAIAAGAFLTVSFPQFCINRERGHVGFLPYDYVGAWTADGAYRDVSLLESSANYSLSYNYTGYPYHVHDNQLLSLKDGIYDRENILAVPQIMGVYANNPLQTLVAIGKKLLMAFDPQTSDSYPSETAPWRTSKGFLYSALNYFVLGSALYMLLFSDKICRHEKLLFGSVAVGLIMPQMIVHVEWRYFLSSYILLYYFFAYYFVGDCLASRDGCKYVAERNFCPWIVTLIFIFFTISLSIYI